ncbi:MAG: histidinol-phosphate transaminase [Lentisphaerae bacterium]|nr:histidinol-phosphate transaminase [Lentisphaerota bacterium]
MIRRTVTGLAAYVPGEQPRDAGVTKLNTNENPYPPSPAVARALAAFDPARLRKYPDPVSGALRARLADLYSFSAGSVFVGNGSDEVLSLCVRVFVDDGGTVGYFNPSYSLYPVLADIRGIAKKPLELDADFGWAMPADYDCDLFFITYPNAPTGTVFPRARIEEFCDRTRGTVVIDEAYAEFADGDCLELARTRRNVLVARTLSKSYSLAGLRVGYALGPAELIGAMDKVRDSYNLDALSQEAALAALSDVDHMRRNAARVRATRQRMTAAIEAMGHRVWPSQANFIWAKPAGIAAQALYENLKARRIFVRYFAGPRTGDFVRITVGTDAEADVLLKAMEELK